MAVTHPHVPRMTADTISFFKYLFLVFAAILPIMNPAGAAPMFLNLTPGATPETRAALSRMIATFIFFLLLGAMFIGSYVLDFFGISIPVVRVGGGLLVCATGWRLLTASESQDTHDAVQASASGRSGELKARAFYPLAFPITCGPGSIAVAITLGASLKDGGRDSWLLVGAALSGILLLAISVYLCFRFADRLLKPLGDTGTTVFLRLSAFVLLCVGVQIFWDGASELLAPWRPVAR
jgi:multiple antibiotic resistance protein